MNIKLKVRLLPVIIQIGKAGLSEAIIKEIKAQLKNKKLIKVKFLKTAMKDKNNKNSPNHEFLECKNRTRVRFFHKKELFKELAQKTQSEIVYSRGFVITLYKK